MSPKSSEARQPSFAGFALGRWTFGLRTWIAMILALYVAFWCQLDGASSAATCVGILALPTRGQAFQKALYRLSATVIGVMASLVLTGLFAQSRDLFVVAYAGWIGLCVFTASFFDGTRAYGFLLSGYTVAIVSVIDIDSPQNVFSSGINRGAAIVVGIVATAFVNDLFAAPDLYPKLLARLAATRDKSRAFAVAVVSGEPRSAIEAAGLLKEITALQADIDALSTEASNGRHRVEAARSAVSAMVGQIDDARAAARVRDVPEARDDALIVDLAPALRGADRGGSVVPSGSESGSPVDESSVQHASVVRHVASLADNYRLATESLSDMRAGRRPRRSDVRLPRYHSPEVAARRGLRLGLAIAFSSIFFIHSSWPMTSTSFAFLGSLGALSSNTPSPRNFARATLVGMSLAVVAAGVTEFLILDGVDQFPLLAIAIAPTVIAACLLLTSANPKLPGIGFVLMVFFTVILAPSNPQSYNPQIYILVSVLAITAALTLAFWLTVITPTSDAMRRRWSMRAAGRDLRDALAGRAGRRGLAAAAFRSADRVGQVVGLSAKSDGARRRTVHHAMLLNDAFVAAMRAQASLDALGRADASASVVSKGRLGLRLPDPVLLREAAEGALALAEGRDPFEGTVAREAAADLFSASNILGTEWRTLRRLMASSRHNV